MYFLVLIRGREVNNLATSADVTHAWSLIRRTTSDFLLYSILQANLDSPLAAEPVGLGHWFLGRSEVLAVSLMPKKAGLMGSMVHELHEPEQPKSGPKNAG